MVAWYKAPGYLNILELLLKTLNVRKPVIVLFMFIHLARDKISRHCNEINALLLYNHLNHQIRRDIILVIFPKMKVCYLQDLKLLFFV